MTTWGFLRRLYRVPGARRNFDLVALHPYASSVSRMRAQVMRVRGVMAAAGDAVKPLLITELGVASTGSAPSVFVRGFRGQAEFLGRAFQLLGDERERWHIAGVDWFAWQDLPGLDPHCSFCEGAGLFDVRGRPKPAWGVFRRLALRGGAEDVPRPALKVR